MSLYYEIHITLHPDFDRVEELKDLAGQFGYHMADLIYMKGEVDPWKGDMFVTGRAANYGDAKESVIHVADQLKRAGFKPIRYKVEDTIIDSRREDKYGLL